MASKQLYNEDGEIVNPIIEEDGMPTSILEQIETGYNHSQISGNPHKTKSSDIDGLSEELEKLDTHVDNAENPHSTSFGNIKGSYTDNALLNAKINNINNHMVNEDNPHKTSFSNIKGSYSENEELNAQMSVIDQHMANKNNPHETKFDDLKDNVDPFTKAVIDGSSLVLYQHSGTTTTYTPTTSGFNYLTLTGDSGTLTSEQLAVLTESKDAYIMLDNKKYTLQENEQSNDYLTYVNINSGTNTINSIDVVISTLDWSKTSYVNQQKLYMHFITHSAFQFTIINNVSTPYSKLPTTNDVLFKAVDKGFVIKNSVYYKVNYIFGGSSVVAFYCINLDGTRDKTGLQYPIISPPDVTDTVTEL